MIRSPQKNGVYRSNSLDVAEDLLARHVQGQTKLLMGKCIVRDLDEHEIFVSLVLGACLEYACLPYQKIQQKPIRPPPGFTDPWIDARRIMDPRNP